jgi:hypothetical protein
MPVATAASRSCVVFSLATFLSGIVLRMSFRDCAADVLITGRRAAGVCAVGEAPPGSEAAMTSSV